MNKFFSGLWKLGIYVLLIVILYIVIIYKVTWEGKEIEEEYLYFYMCKDNLCTTQKNINNYLSKYKCTSSCPLVVEIIDEEKVKLQYNNNTFVYNYKKGEIENED